MSEILRLTGRVTSLDESSGENSETGRPWRFTAATVAISPFARVRATLDDKLAPDIYDGQDVDLIVEVTGNKQGFVRVRAVDKWPTQSPALV